MYISDAHSGDGEGEQFSCGSKENSGQGPNHSFMNTRQITSCLLKSRVCWHKSKRMDLVKGVTISVLKYSACLGYLERWMAPMEEFSTFMWMDLNEIPDWNDVEGCIRHLAVKGVEIDDAKCFDQVTNLKKFIERSNSDEDFSDLQAHQKWTKFLEKSKSVDFHSELLKIAVFFCNTCSQCKCRANLFADASPMDQEEESLVS